MIIKFDLSNTCQSALFFEGLKIEACDKLIAFSKENPNITRSVALLIAGGFQLFALAKIVSTVGEQIIKGLANIFGAMIFEKCSFSRGVKQLFIQLPLQLLYGSVRMSLGVVYELLGLTVLMLSDPVVILETIKRVYENEKQALDIISNNGSSMLPDDDSLLEPDNSASLSSDNSSKAKQDLLEPVLALPRLMYA